MKISEHDIPLPNADQDKALWYVQQGLREQLAYGEQAVCACCGGDVKVYARAMTAAQLRVLRELCKSEDGLTARQIVARTAVQGGDAGKLQHWGLTSFDDEDKRWRATGQGHMFVRGEVTVPHRVLIFHGRVIGYDYSRLINVRDVDPEFNLERDVMSASAVRDAEMAL
jgi:xanthine/CO dehydrogenase XdhC/CoxF family maturation factor